MGFGFNLCSLHERLCLDVSPPPFFDCPPGHWSCPTRQPPPRVGKAGQALPGAGQLAELGLGHQPDPALPPHLRLGAAGRSSRRSSHLYVLLIWPRKRQGLSRFQQFVCVMWPHPDELAQHGQVQGSYHSMCMIQMLVSSRHLQLWSSQPAPVLVPPADTGVCEDLVQIIQNGSASCLGC